MSVALYPPSSFDVYNRIKLHYSSAIDAACQEIKKACQGLGTDEKALTKVLGSHSANDRALIAYRYKELFHQDLKTVLSGETGGDYGFLLQLLVLPLPEAEALIIDRATSGAGTTESLIYPVIMGRSNAEMDVLRKTFFDTYNKDLAVVLDNELSGDFHTVIMSALQAPIVPFNPAFHTQAKAEADADALYKTGEGKWGTDEVGFLKVLLSSPPQHLVAINSVYKNKHKTDLKAAVQNEFTGDAENALVYFVRLALEPKEMLADFFESTMKGIGTDELGLSAAVVRFHPYLSTIAATYQQRTKSSLKERIKGEVGGDFGELLVKVMDAPCSPPSMA